jgi:hypothetical protein
MTVQFKVEWNGYDAGGVYTLSAPEEARLIAAGIAFNYVPVTQVQAGLTSAQLAAGAVAPAAVSSTGSILGADGSPVSGGDTRAPGTRIGVDGYRVATDYITVPTEIPNCELWLDAAWAEKSDGTPCAVDGDVVATIRDASGNGRHATGSAVFSAAGGKAGRPGFVGKLVTPGFLTAAMGQAFTLVTVAADGNPTAWKCRASASVGMYMTRNGGNGLKDWSLSGVTGISQLGGNWTTAGGVEVLGWDVAAGQAVQIMDGMGRVATTDNVVFRQASGVGGAVAWTGAQTLTIGGYTATTTDNWPFPTSEAIAYSRLLSDTELLKLFQYLNQKYADRPMVRMVGNSITTGDDLLHSAAGTFLGGLMWAALQGTADVRLDAYPGRTSAQILIESPKYSAVLDAGKKKRVTIVWELTNALGAYSSPAAAYQEVVRICKRYRDAGAYVIVPTCLYRSDGSNGGLATFTQRADRLNAMIAANWRSFADGFVDVLADVRLRNPNDTTYFKSDKIHPNTTGAQILRDLMMPEVNRLLAL